MLGGLLESLEEGGSLEDLGLEEFEAAQGHVEVLLFKVQDHACDLRGNSAIKALIAVAYMFTSFWT